MSLFNPNPIQKDYYLPFQSADEAYSGFIRFSLESQSSIENSVKDSTDLHNHSLEIVDLSIEQFSKTLDRITSQGGGEARFNFLSILFRGFQKAVDEVSLMLDDFIEADLSGETDRI